MKQQSIFVLLCLAFYCHGRPQFLGFAGLPDAMMGPPEMNFDIDLPGFDRSKMSKTTKTKKLKDGTEVTTTNINGPGVMIHEESAVKSDKDSKAGNASSMASSFSPFLLKGFPISFGGLFGSMGPKKCKPKCKKDKEYCNEDIGKCVPTLKIGYDCQQNEECQSGLFCVWGVCNEAKRGDAGTLCTKEEDCSEKRICRSDNEAPFSKKHCLARLSEGAPCGSAGSLTRSLFTSTSTDDDKKKINPCSEGLKCVVVGSSANKICVKSSFKQSIDFEIDNDNNDDTSGDKENAAADDNDDDDDSGDNDDDKPNKMSVKTGDGETIPGSSNKNKKQQNKHNNQGKVSSNKNKKTSGKKNKDNHLKFTQ